MDESTLQGLLVEAKAAATADEAAAMIEDAVIGKASQQDFDAILRCLDVRLQDEMRVVRLELHEQHLLASGAFAALASRAPKGMPFKPVLNAACSAVWMANFKGVIEIDAALIQQVRAQPSPSAAARLVLKTPGTEFSRLHFFCALDQAMAATQAAVTGGIPRHAKEAAVMEALKGNPVHLPTGVHDAHAVEVLALRAVREWLQASPAGLRAGAAGNTV
jgi:hypothetical protein